MFKPILVADFMPGLIECLTEPFRWDSWNWSGTTRSIALSYDESQIVRQEDLSDLFWVSAGLTIHPFFLRDRIVRPILLTAVHDS